MTVRTAASVRVGDTFGPITVPVSRQSLVDYAAASGDDNPIHQNEEFARGVGLPDVIAHGMWTMGATGSVLADWVGGSGRILEFGTRFSAMVVVPVDGSAIEVSGSVTSLDEESGQAVVELTTSAAGAKVLSRCRATVQLG
jgi:acyl dehydratase